MIKRGATNTAANDHKRTDDNESSHRRKRSKRDWYVQRRALVQWQATQAQNSVLSRNQRDGPEMQEGGGGTKVQTMVRGCLPESMQGCRDERDNASLTVPRKKTSINRARVKNKKWADDAANQMGNKRGVVGNSCTSDAESQRVRGKNRET